LKHKVWLVGTGVLAMVGLYATPYLALHQMREAARTHDVQALAAYVDFPAVRESLKLGLRAKLVGGDVSPASVMGAEVAGALLGPMVDALITTESLGRVLQGQAPAQAVLLMGKAPPPVRVESPIETPMETRMQTQMGYESPSQFVFSIKPRGSDDDPVELVMRRDGLWRWKLAALRLS
jgi:hypothetical protein